MTIRVGRQLARGSRSAVHEWGAGAVVKVPFASTPEGWIEFEGRYTAAVHSAGAPAPRLLGIELIGGRAASIYERVEGGSMWDHLAAHPRSVARHAHTLVDLQSSLARLVPPVSLPRLGDRLGCKIADAARMVAGPLADAAASIPTTTAIGLCHGDLHPGNVILARRGPVLVDWFDVCRGDPLFDVARTALLLRAIDHRRPPAHLGGTDPIVVDVMRGAYLAAVDDEVTPDHAVLDRWEAVASVARIAERGPSERLVAIWDAWRTGRADG